SPSGDTHLAYLPARAEGFSSTGSTPWKSCIYTAAQGTNEDVAYLFHGRNLDEKLWNDNTYYTSMIQKTRQETGDKPPKIVTISFGRTWLLTRKGSSSQAGLLDVLTREVLPAVEARIGKPHRRLVFGESMGGVNTLLAALKTHGVFQKAISLCPV